MREILFRGKRIDTGEWVYGDVVRCAVSGHVYIKRVGDDVGGTPDHFEPQYFCGFDVDPKTVGQYIGMTDKIEIKIFEHDIVRITLDGVYYHSRNEDEELENEKFYKTEKTLLTICKFINGRFTFKVLLAYDDDGRVQELEGRMFEVKWRCKKYEVSGNIFDNPELVQP